MRGFVSLVHKEWRDVRAITWASMALVVVACVIVRWVLGEMHDQWVHHVPVAGWPGPPRFLELFVPLATALYAALVASDTVGGDVASRRIEPLALLPVRPFRVWLAKAATLVGATVLFALWTALVQTWTLTAVDGWEHAHPFATLAAAQWGVIWAVLASAGFVLLVSTAGLRGLGAVITGGLVFAAVAGALAAGLDEVVNDRFLRGQVWTISGVLAVIAFASSAAAFAWGRVHLPSFRPLRVAVRAFVVACAVPASAGAWAMAHVAPGSSLDVLESAQPSPDGRFVALQWSNCLATENWRRGLGNPMSRGAWVLDLRDGSLRDVHAAGAVIRRWNDDGTLDLVRGLQSGVEELRWNPATGAVAVKATHTPEQWHEAANRAFHEANSQANGPVWWNFAKRPESPTRWRAYAKGKTQREFESVVRPTLAGGIGLVMHAPDAGHLALLDLETGAQTVVLEAPGMLDRAELQFCGRHAAAVHNRSGWFVVELATHRVRPLPPEVRNYVHPLGREATPRLFQVGWTDGRTYVLDLETGRRVAYPPTSAGGSQLVLLPDGGIAFVHHDGSFQRWDRDLNPVEAPRTRRE